MKTATTIKPYKTHFGGYDITIPIGAEVSNNTACGEDDNYRFWTNYHKIAAELTGYKDSMLKHDLTYYGVNIPAEYCSEWAEGGCR